MAELKYKTRAMSSPKGKPKVYFCCHPEDFERCFEKITEDILKKQNCAIWYLEDDQTERDEEYLDELKQMQLFVIPVTTTLLCTKNAALDVELSFAIKNHIPVLPLMQEPGLEQLFNEKCGELQFLDEHNQDLTAIRYEEKLEKYLAAVLIGDELAEQIRAAFDAYVFLSYRKKDRKYARELMSLIHKNDFCRDIAIWYDEYLVPGENFNDSIRLALEKSDLFVLTVTPNLVNEDNYIIRVEYPAAKEEGKTVLPVEVVPTDKGRLAQCFKDIDECTDAHDEQKLSQALLDSLKIVAVSEKENDPRHNFFIGLAYLGGVDMEIDFKKAVELIEGAAKSGLIEAVEKLVSMYQNGHGVERNYYKVYQWQQEELRLKKEKYEECETAGNAAEILDTCILIGDTAVDLNQCDKAQEYYEEAQEFCESLFDTFPCESENWKDWKILILNRFSLLMNHKKNYKKGLFYETQTVEQYEKLSIREKNMLGIYYVNLGISHTNCENYKEAKDCLLKGITTLEECLAEGMDHRRTLCHAYHTCANIEATLLNMAEAKLCFEKAISICRKLNEEFENSYLDDYAAILADEAYFFTRDKDPEKAKAEMEEACSLIKEYLTRNPKMMAYGRLANYLNILGMISLDQKRFEEAKEYLKEALKILELKEEFADVYKMDRAIVYNNLGTACLNGKEYEDALYYLKRSAQLYSQYEEGEHERQLGILYRNLSLCYLHLGDYEKSHEEIGKCCELYKKLIHTDKERNRAYFCEYTMALASKADVYLKQKRIFSAIKYGINAYMFLWWTVVKWLFKKL